MDVKTGNQARLLRGCPAFTLIELLVVIAVIAILAALLLPALSRAKEKGQAVKSLSNVKQWVYAFHMYEDDHEDYFPYEGNPFASLIDPINKEAWYNVTTVYMDQEPLTTLYVRGWRPMPGQNSIWVCPSVRRLTGPPPSLTNPYFMYAFNNRMDPNAPLGSFKRSQVTYPSQTITFTESEGSFPAATWQSTPRHNMRANLGFVDGHGEAVHKKDYWRNSAAGEDTSDYEFNTGTKVYWYPFKGALP